MWRRRYLSTLRGHADGRVARSVTRVAAAPLDYLEAQPPTDRLRVEVQELDGLVALVEDAEIPHRRDQAWVQLASAM